jgi:hypothetical protein
MKYKSHLRGCKVKASSKAEAKQKAESKEGKPASKVREYGEEAGIVGALLSR